MHLLASFGVVVELSDLAMGTFFLGFLNKAIQGILFCNFGKSKGEANCESVWDKFLMFILLLSFGLLLCHFEHESLEDIVHYLSWINQ